MSSECTSKEYKDFSSLAADIGLGTSWRVSEHLSIRLALSMTNNFIFKYYDYEEGDEVSKAETLCSIGGQLQFGLLFHL